MSIEWMIVECSSKGDFDSAQMMFREYASWLNVDLCFQDFEAELATLPGKYARPKGTIFLALIDELVVGCAAVRPFEDQAELKRLYVNPDYRGLGIGEELLRQCIEFSRQAGYRSIVLDTLARLTSAGKLYRAFGFEQFTNYNDTDLDGIEFYRLSLEPAG